MTPRPAGLFPSIVFIALSRTFRQKKLCGKRREDAGRAGCPRHLSGKIRLLSGKNRPLRGKNATFPTAFSRIILRSPATHAVSCSLRSQYSKTPTLHLLFRRFVPSSPWLCLFLFK